jgi:type III secretory pathway component EscS
LVLADQVQLVRCLEQMVATVLLQASCLLVAAVVGLLVALLLRFLWEITAAPAVVERLEEIT